MANNSMRTIEHTRTDPRFNWLNALFMILVVMIVAGCSTAASETGVAVSMAASDVTKAESISTQTMTPTISLPPPTATVAHTPSPPPPRTSTATLTEIPTSTNTPTVTPPPPTPSGEEAIYFYAILNKSDDPKQCDYIAVAINTGIWRTGDVAADLKTALRSMFVKRQYFGALYNPAYLSNISVQSVDFKSFTGEISIRLAGTYVRSGDSCDDGRVRAQIWSTIRQFPEVKTIDILLNGNLLGDILAPGRKR